MPGPAIRSAAFACVLALAGPGYQEETPANASPTVALSRSPDGLAIAGVTAVGFIADASDANGDPLTLACEVVLVVSADFLIRPWQRSEYLRDDLAPADASGIEMLPAYEWPLAAPDEG
jgi:hypothetical protein